MSDNDNELKGAAKKEAFHLAAEAMIVNFGFQKPAIDIPAGKKAHVKLAGTNSCRASVQVLNRGGENNLHYHPNMDGIWMVLKGRLRWYGAHDKVMGEFGPMEGIVQPENSRYWFESIGDEEAWLVQIGGYPKGKAAARKIHIGAKAGQPAV